jgi:CubicO group peptidase (beta-lactamase class C family)
MMSNPHSHIPGGEATYGYGLTLEARQGLHWVEHGGSRAGYGSLISMVPEHKFAVIVLGNRTGVQLPKLADALRAALVAFQPELPKKPDTHPLEAAELKRYAGAYRNGTTKLVFSIDQGALVETGGAQKMRYARGGDGFLLSDARPGAEPQRVVVVPDSKGGVEFLFAGGRAFRRE